MKKLLFALGILATAGVQAQYTVTDHDGNPILNNSVHTFSSTSIDQATLGFTVTNVSGAPIDMKIQCIDVVNATGAGMELCFGNVCLSSVSEGTMYPPGPAVTLAPGQTNSEFDHFFNTNAGDGANYPIDYTFKFLMLDSEGDEVGTPLFMTYRYTGTLSSGEFDMANMGVKLQSSLIGDVLTLKADKNVQMQLFDINGKLVSSHKLSAGEHTVDASSMSSGIYVANFSNEQGQKSSAKVIKK